MVSPLTPFITLLDFGDSSTVTLAVIHTGHQYSALWWLKLRQSTLAGELAAPNNKIPRTFIIVLFGNLQLKPFFISQEENEESIKKV